MFRIKRSFTAVMLASAMVFGATTASADKKSFVEVTEEEVVFTEVELTKEERAENEQAMALGEKPKVVRLETFAANGDRAEVTISGGQAVIVYQAKDGKGDALLPSGDNVSYGWWSKLKDTAVRLLSKIVTDKGSEESGSSSGNSGDTGAGGSGSCTVNVSNNSGSVIVIAPCGPA